MTKIDKKPKRTRKAKRKLEKQRIRQYINSQEAIAELEKFIEIAGSVRKAAESIGVATQYIYAWRLNNVLISDAKATAMANVAGVDKDLLLKRTFTGESNIFSSLRDLITSESMNPKIRVSEMTADEIYDNCLSEELLSYINNVSLVNKEEKLKKASKMLSAIFGNKPSKWAKDIRFLKSLK